MSWLSWVLIVLGSVVALLGALWIVVPSLTGLPWVPTRRARVRRALELAGVRPGETVYDLGAGDGRTLIVAAREFGARAVGIEIEPLHCAVAWATAWFAGVVKRVSIRCGSFYRADLSDADVVFVYVTPQHAARLGALLAPQLRAGARVVSVAADLPGWQPAAVDREHLIFLYRMPPEPGSLESFLAQSLGRTN
jgi:SAM-dependent methyltransferase